MERKFSLSVEQFPKFQAVFCVQVILDCSVGGSPLPEILWTKDGYPVQLSNRIQQLYNGSLVIKNSIVSLGLEKPVQLFF